MIVIPSLPLPDDAAAARARIDEWQWLGYQRVEISLRSRNSTLDPRRLADELLRDTMCPVQIAGNFRSGDDVESAFATGAMLVVLGSRAIDEPDWRATLTGQFPDQLLVSAPLRERRVRTRGAVRALPLDLRDVAEELSGERLAGLVVDLADEEVGHAELGMLEDVVEEASFPVFVTGGSPSLTMLRDLEFRGVAGAIIDAAHLSAAFDEQTLARSFAD